MQTKPRCPRCYTLLVIQLSTLGPYWVCPNYPNCMSPVTFPKLPESEYQLANAA